MKRAMLWALLLVLAGCAQSPARQAAERRASERMVDAIIVEGPALLCTQKSWQTCTLRGQQQCMQEVEALRGDCQAEGRIMSGATPNVDNGKQFSQVYMTCLIERHIATLRPRTRDEVSACLEQNPLDKALLTERMNRLSKPIVDDMRKEIEAARKKPAATP